MTQALYAHMNKKKNQKPKNPQKTTYLTETDMRGFINEIIPNLLLQK
jgi:hypothetical protein